MLWACSILNFVSPGVLKGVVKMLTHDLVAQPSCDNTWRKTMAFEPPTQGQAYGFVGVKL